MLSTLALSFVLTLAPQEAAPSATRFGARALDRYDPTGPSGVVVMGRPRPGFLPLLTHADPRSLNRNATQDSGAQNETGIALDPLNPLNLVGGTNDYRYGDSGAGVAVSFDGGLTWTADTLAGLDASLGKYSTQGDPWIEAYPGGVFYYSFIDFNRNDDQNRLCVARSTDGGLTWPQLGVIIDHTGGGSHDFEDKELIAVDDTGGSFDGNVYIAWTRFPAAGLNRIMFSRSTNSGATFSAPMQISDTADGGYQGTSPGVGTSGEVYVAWYHSGTIGFDSSTDGGVTFGTDVTVSSINDISSPLPGADFRLNSFPNLAVDKSGTATNGNLYVVWADESGPTGDPDVLLSRSIDGGATWSAPIRVSDDSNGSYQWMAAIDVDSTGTVTVTFCDERRGPGIAEYDIYMAQSVDGGLSFRANARLTNERSDSTLDGFGGFFIGDYSGLAVSTPLVVPYWPDCRPSNGNCEGYVRPLRMRRAR